ncbi:hypothetical protein C5167_040460 [Papaver somniferum]|uniref:Uncharacterized protein n=1 Tax=Papaver somniferum TaxID=3469 RepID=A0A4Y7IF17_PAPSO|nr:hypothetical protein C5167_040460 [Papaver somniferum]
MHSKKYLTNIQLDNVGKKIREFEELEYEISGMKADRVLRYTCIKILNDNNDLAIRWANERMGMLELVQKEEEE